VRAARRERGGRGRRRRREVYLSFPFFLPAVGVFRTLYTCTQTHTPKKKRRRKATRDKATWLILLIFVSSNCCCVVGCLVCFIFILSLVWLLPSFKSIVLDTCLCLLWSVCIYIDWVKEEKEGRDTRYLTLIYVSFSMHKRPRFPPPRFLPLFSSFWVFTHCTKIYRLHSHAHSHLLHLFLPPPLLLIFLFLLPFTHVQRWRPPSRPTPSHHPKQQRRASPEIRHRLFYCRLGFCCWCCRWCCWRCWWWRRRRRSRRLALLPRHWW